jgi:hypothetical protein
MRVEQQPRLSAATPAKARHQRARRSSPRARRAPSRRGRDPRHEDSPLGSHTARWSALWPGVSDSTSGDGSNASSGARSARVRPHTARRYEPDRRPLAQQCLAPRVHRHRHAAAPPAPGRCPRGPRASASAPRRAAERATASTASPAVRESRVHQHVAEQVRAHVVAHERRRASSASDPLHARARAARSTASLLGTGIAPPDEAR